MRIEKAADERPHGRHAGAHGGTAAGSLRDGPPAFPGGQVVLPEEGCEDRSPQFVRGTDEEIDDAARGWLRHAEAGRIG